MAKVPIHFIGFLANVGHSLAGLKMGEGFVIEHKTNDDVAPFLRMIDKHYGLPKGFGFLTRRYHCVVRADLAQFDGTPQGGVAIRPNVLDKAYRLIRDRCRLLRLFKEGNIVLAYSFLYHLTDADKEVKPFGLIREYPIMDATPFRLTTAEVLDAEVFLQTTSLPFQDKALQLAIESFDKSYESDDISYAFLSLMIAMEVLLGPKDPYGAITHRISRNAAVLLGKDREEGERVFEDMKDLYKKRSRIVHGGKSTAATCQDVLRLRQYVREAIREVLSSRMSKEELPKMLNTCGFGQRPWRENAK